MKKQTLIAMLLALGTASCANMGGGGAQDPVMLRLQSVENRTDQLERQMKAVTDMSNNVNQTQAQTRELRGQIEQLSLEVESNKRRIRELYLDLDRRVSALEGNGGSTAAATGAAPAGPQVGGEEAPAPSDAERQAYLSAFNLLKSGHYDKAVSAFDDFLKQHPASSYADNALYWKGEAEYVNREYDKAMTDFQALQSKHPNSAKIPGALLKIGYIYYEQGKYDQARGTLTSLRKKYPNTTAASLAQKRLERMQQEGK